MIGKNTVELKVPVEAHPFDTSAPSLTKRALDHPDLLSGDYWRELRTFLCLAKTGSLSRAAEALGSSRPTVGRDIRRLQDLMGVQLSVFSNSGAVLTEKGRELADELLRLDQHLFSITSNLRSEKGEDEGSVRLGITDGLGIFFLVPALRRFSARYPKLHVHIKSPGNLKNIRENQTDVTLGFFPDASQDMTCHPLGWLHFIPIATQGYIDRMGLPTRSNIGSHHFIDSEIYSAKGPWDAWRALINRGTVAHSCDVSLSYGMMVKAGLGIGLIGNFNMVEPSARPLDLGVHIKLRLYAIALTERLETKPVRIVFEMLENLFGPQSAWFQEELVLAVDDPAYREGHALLFNL